MDEPRYTEKEWRAFDDVAPGCMDAFSLPSHGFRRTNSDRLIEAQESPTAESAQSETSVSAV